MSINAAPSGADVSGASSSAPTKPASAGLPSRADLVRHMNANAEKAPSEPASSDGDNEQADGALGAAPPDKKPEGDTAEFQAGKGDEKPKDKKEPDVPPWFKERLGKEKGKREKLTADLSAAKLETAEVRRLFEVAVAENERLTEALRTGQQFDERGEELQALRIQQQARDELEKLRTEHKEKLRAQMIDVEAEQLATRWRTEIAQAAQTYPAVSPAYLRDELRKNPEANISELAKAEHEKLIALVSKQGASKAAASDIPTTVAKPSGASRFEYEASKGGIRSFLNASRAKG